MTDLCIKQSGQLSTNKPGHWQQKMAAGKGERAFELLMLYWSLSLCGVHEMQV